MIELDNTRAMKKITTLILAFLLIIPAFFVQPNSAVSSVSIGPDEVQTWRYLKFTILGTRTEPTTICTQISELKLRLSYADVVWPAGTSVTNPGGNFSSTQIPNKIIDGNLSTKWCDLNGTGATHSVLIIDAVSPVTFDSYRYVTGNNAPERDPVLWTLEATNDLVSGDWTTIDVRTNAYIPTARNAYTSSFYLNMANITVNVIDEYGNPLTGANWYPTGGGEIYPKQGAGATTRHLVSMDSTTDDGNYMIAGYPATLGAKSFGSIVTSDGPGSTVYLRRGQNKTVTIQYTSGPLPCLIDLKADGQDTISVQPGASAVLTWTSSNVSGTNGVGFDTAGAVQNTSGVTVTPTETTVYAINNIPDPTDGVVCFDQVEVTVVDSLVNIKVVSNLPAFSIVTTNWFQASIFSIQEFAGYTYVVTNSQGTGQTMSLLVPGPYQFTITYTPTGNYEFSLLTPADVAVSRSPNQPAQVQQAVTAQHESGVPTAVTFTASNLPTSGSGESVGVSYANQDCVPALTFSDQPPCTVTLTLTVPYSIPVGIYPITVTGSSGDDNNESTIFNLIVEPDSSSAASCTVSPTIAKVGEPVTWTANPPSGSGDDSPFVYTWSGTDFPTTETINPYVATYQSTGVKTASFTMTNDVTTATCPSVTVYVGVAPDYTEI